MTLIVAIEPDRRQANYLSAMVRHRLKAELLLAASADEAIRALKGRVPDVILTSALLSPKDESVLADWLRTLDAAAAHIQTLTIPVFSSAPPRASQRVRGMFASFMGSSSEEEAPGSPDGCDPAMFAEQCADYLERAQAQRASNEPEYELEEDIEPAEEPQPEPTLEPVVMVQAMKPTEVVREPAAEFIEFDLSTLLDERRGERPSKTPSESAAPELAADDEEAPIAPSSDIWVAPRLGAERLWPKAEVPDVRSEPAPASAPAAARSAGPRSVAPRPAAPRPAVVKPQGPARRISRVDRSQDGKERPIQDEWGFFDPEQCGFAALLAKLHEITERDDPPAKQPA